MQVFLEADDNVFIYALILLNRFLAKMKFLITSRNAYPLMMISCAISVKYLMDNPPSDLSLARLAGIPLRSFISLESSFLEYMDYKLYCDKRIFRNYRKYIAKML